MQVIDNFLSEGEFKNLRDYISSTSFPWYFGLVTTDSKIAQFVHTFYANDTPTSTWPHVAFLREKLNMAALVRIKVNLNPKTCLLYTSPSPRDRTRSRMPSSA